MTAIGEVLGWKFNHEPGIRTQDNRIIAWPKSLGPEPTARDIETFTAEFEAAEEDVKAGQIADAREIRAAVELMADLTATPNARALYLIKLKAIGIESLGR